MLLYISRQYLCKCDKNLLKLAKFSILYFQGPSTPTPGDDSLLSVSISYSFQGLFTQVILGGFTSSLPFVSKSSNDSTTKKMSSDEVDNKGATVSPRPDDKVELNSKSDEKTGDPTTPPPVDLTSGVVEQTTRYLEHNSSYVGADNSSSVCLFKDSKLRVFDVVVYLTVDLVLSVLALFLGGALLIAWLVFSLT